MYRRYKMLYTKLSAVVVFNIDGPLAVTVSEELD